MKVTRITDDGTLLYARCEGPVSQVGLVPHSDLLAEVLGPAYAARKVLLDMERSEFIDSGGVGWLIGNHKRFAAGGGVLVLYSVPPRIMQVLQILSMHLIFNIAANAVSARAVALGEMGEMSAAGLQINVNDVEPDEAVNRLVDHAAGLGVSDLFFGCNEDHVNVSGRHLGMLRLLTVMPAEFGHRCLAHLKGQAGMDVFERRRPQDGRWLHRRAGNGSVDVRVNTIPTLHGEDCALRLLVRESRLLELANLGLLRRDYNQLLSLLNSPGGLLLVSGPTGAGKTTTLYACLAQLNNGERKINTIEDPIEQAVTGLRQSQVNPKVEVGFPELLRSVLRQSPDVVMVGEIRDPVSAETAVRAGNSGHLVLATLHAPTAAATIQSMLSLGVHPHFLASSLLGVIAQRLIRTLCPQCRVAFELADPAQTFAEVRQWLEPGQGQGLYGPKGCPACRGVGYAGQSGLFEVIAVTKGLRQHIADRQPTQVIRQKAIEDGMTELRHSALLKVAQGTTTIEEVFRTVPSEFLGMD